MSRMRALRWIMRFILRYTSQLRSIDGYAEEFHCHKAEFAKEHFIENLFSFMYPLLDILIVSKRIKLLNEYYLF